MKNSLLAARSPCCSEKLMKKKKYRIAVFASGRGSNFEAIWKMIKAGRLHAEISVVVSSNPNAGILKTAEKCRIPSCVLTGKETDLEIIAMLQGYRTDYIVLAGYLRKIGDGLIQCYHGKIFNIHPALLPAFGGKGYYGIKVHEAVIRSGTKFSGPTVHFVDNEYDHGPIIMQDIVKVKDDDDPHSLQKRVLKKEHKIYWRAIKKVLDGHLRVEGCRVLSSK